MWCGKCDHHLSQCTCPDIEERLESLRNNPHIHAPSVVDANLEKIRKNREQESREE